MSATGGRSSRGNSGDQQAGEDKDNELRHFGGLIAGTEKISRECRIYFPSVSTVLERLKILPAVAEQIIVHASARASMTNLLSVKFHEGIWQRVVKRGAEGRRGLRGETLLDAIISHLDSMEAASLQRSPVDS